MKNKIEIEAIRDRPRFKIKVQMSKKEFCRKLKLHFDNRKMVLGGYITEDLSLIRLRKDKDKFWAPNLEITVEKDEDVPGQIIIRGVFGPKPAIWTLSMFSYGLGGAIILTTGLYGWIELALGIGEFWIWSNLVGLLLIIGPYVSAKIGQRIAQNHMRVLRVFMERVVVEEKLV